MKRFCPFCGWESKPVEGLSGEPFKLVGRGIQWSCSNPACPNRSGIWDDVFVENMKHQEKRREKALRKQRVILEEQPTPEEL